MDYRSIIESKYNRENWQALLHDIFKTGANFRTTPIPVDAHSNLAASSVQLGTITLTDDNKIAVYEIKLSETVDIVANRVGIRNLLASDWKMKGCVGAFMFCFRDNESVLRFSYVSQTMGFGEDGKLVKNETDTKRYTYYLGEGHRSRTAIKQFEELKNSKLGLADITKAFSIEALSDKFFKDYKDIYEDIVEYVTGKRMIKVSNKWEERVIKAPNESIMNGFRCFPNPDKAVRDYVKNLMGRIVFLQFIQKKGWLGVPVGKEWGEGDKEFLQNLYDRCDQKDNFIDGILEVLFNDINTKRTNDVANTVLGTDIKIPYLNGGLFELSKADECSFRLPKKLMDAIITFFGSYNFTIDENDPDDAEIGVDPEMLGRIFENLLEDNKDKGAFYTPKEIVQYMCKESLITYLQTDKYDSEKEAIRQFVTTYNANVLSSSLLADVDQKLKDVKICDPAIGSGAFPMGLLKELFACRSALEDLSGENAADIKKHIIQNNIYGVDIEKGAVDIARLRFWLSIIVDELTPHALPNMDFKIMQGNSLIPTFNGKYVNLNDKLRHVNSSKIRDAKKELFRLQSIFYEAEGSLKKELMVKIKYQILEIVKLQMDYEHRAEVANSSYSLSLFDDDPVVQVCRVDPEKARIIGVCTELQRKLNSVSSPLNERADIPLPFFDWTIMFSDIFQDSKGNGGFDIVIANPPYLFLSGKGSPVRRLINDGKTEEAEKLQYLLDIYATLYPDVSEGCRDFYKWFYKLGMTICRNGGVLSYITPDTFFNMPKYKDLRRCLFSNKVEHLVDLGFSVFDAPTVSSSTLLLVKDSVSHESTKLSDVKLVLTKDNRAQLPYFASEYVREVPVVDYEICAYKHSIANAIYNSTDFISLDNYLSFTEGEHNIQIDLDKVSEVDRSGYVPVLVDCEMLRNHYVRKAYVESALTRSEIHDGPRCLLRKTGDSLFAAIPQNDDYAIAHQNVYVVKANSQSDDMKFWMGFLNSKLLTFLYQNGLYGQKGRTMAQFRIYALNALPSPRFIPDTIKQSIAKQVELILKLDPKSQLEQKISIEKAIDSLIYKIYGIKENEVIAIEEALK